MKALAYKLGSQDFIVSLTNVDVYDAHIMTMEKNDFTVDKFMLWLQDFILEHYSEDGIQYEDSIAEFMDIRQASACIMATGNMDFRILWV